jgi:hypothetical protein
MKRCIVSLLCVLTLSLAGCAKSTNPQVAAVETAVSNMTPEQVAAVATKAGGVSAAIWKTAAKPTADQKAQVGVVLDTISAACGGYSGGSFSEMFPALRQVMDAKITDKTLSPFADGLLNGALLGLDLLFDQHPEWVVDGQKSAAGVKAFVDGARAALK